MSANDPSTTIAAHEDVTSREAREHQKNFERLPAPMQNCEKITAN